MSIAIIANIKVKPGTRDQYLEQLAGHRERCLAGEPGTLAFEVLVPDDNDNEIMLYEVYSDQAALDAHMTGESMAIVRKNAADIHVSLNGTLCKPLS